MTVLPKVRPNYKIFTTVSTQGGPRYPSFSAPVFDGEMELKLDDLKKAVKDLTVGYKKVMILTHGFNTTFTKFTKLVETYCKLYKDVFIMALYWDCPTTVSQDTQDYFKEKLHTVTFAWVAKYLWSRYSTKICLPALYAQSSEMASWKARSLYYLFLAVSDAQDSNNFSCFLVAHSLGVRIVLEALKLLVHDSSIFLIEAQQCKNPVISEYLQKASRLPDDLFKRLIFKQGDCDTMLFNELMSYFTWRKIPISKNTRIFYRKDDKALKLSQAIHGHSRVGLRPLNETSKDAGGFTADPEDDILGLELNHSYWSDEQFQKQLGSIFDEI